jgi:beta-lactam-binding protein with PASTA domain
VPNVRGLLVEKAAPFFQAKELNYVVVDSFFLKNTENGIIIETSPPIGTSVKKGRTIYLTINSYSAQLILIPDLVDLSQRQAASILNAIGFDNVKEKLVPGAFHDLVVGLEANGKILSLGDKVPFSATITILVASGLEDIELKPSDVKPEEFTEEETWN